MSARKQSFYAVQQFSFRKSIILSEYWPTAAILDNVMASRRLIYAFQLTGYASESNEKKYICRFMLAIHAISIIYKLLSFSN